MILMNYFCRPIYLLAKPTHGDVYFEALRDFLPIGISPVFTFGNIRVNPTLDTNILTILQDLHQDLYIFAKKLR